MNKPAPKEPSMDEILSSIRQIIADDDAGARKPAASPGPFASAPDSAPAPLALSREQIVTEETPAPPPVARVMPSPYPAAPPPRPASAPAAADEQDEADFGSIDEAHLVEANDIAFGESEPVEPPMAKAPAPVVPPPAVPPSPPREIPRIATPLSEAAPMPDPNLSRDIAEQLLEPATRAAVRSTFSKLDRLQISTPAISIDDMVREMLRPMLKDWLDENLPSVVERMVEKEIAKISRGDG